MKKTLTVNLGGTVFHIDEDAFHLLDKYLTNLKVHFRKEEGADEIVKDMEWRISELFTEKIVGNIQVITIKEVEEVIERMGKPEEITDEDNTKQDNTEQSQQDPYKGQEPSPRRRFFRNPDDRVLGGVASGLAAYMGWDVTAIRLILVFIMFCGYGTIIPIYIVCWMIVPEALTATEKLSMRGEKVTVENIGKTVTDGFEKVTSGVNDYMNSHKPRTTFQHIGDVLVQVVGFCIKAFLILMAVVLSPVLLILMIGLFTLIVATISIAFGGGAAFVHWLPLMNWGMVSSSPVEVAFTCIAGIFLIGIPLAGMIYAVFAHFLNWKPMTHAVKLTLVFLWIASIITTAILLPNVILPYYHNDIYTIGV